MNFRISTILLPHYSSAGSATEEWCRARHRPCADSTPPALPSHDRESLGVQDGDHWAEKNHREKLTGLQLVPIMMMSLLIPTLGDADSSGVTAAIHPHTQVLEINA